jgi:hypothetical protein
MGRYLRGCSSRVLSRTRRMISAMQMMIFAKKDLKSLGNKSVEACVRAVLGGRGPPTCVFALFSHDDVQFRAWSASRGIKASEKIAIKLSPLGGSGIFALQDLQAWLLLLLCLGRSVFQCKSLISRRSPLARAINLHETIALTNWQKEEEVLRVPLGAMLNIEHAMVSQEFASVFALLDQSEFQ